MRRARTFGLSAALVTGVLGALPHTFSQRGHNTDRGYADGYNAGFTAAQRQCHHHR
jgi:hypothetical protein